MSVRKLDGKLSYRVRSLTNVYSISNCVTELILNSLDAQSTSIAIRVNLTTFRIQIIDNGNGISSENFELLGHFHHGNKGRDFQSINDNKSYGYRGESLASICQLSRIVEIVSRHRSGNLTYKKVITSKISKWGAVRKRRACCGTTITIDGVLYNVPVRRSRIKKDVELENTRKCVQRICILNPGVSISLLDAASGKLILAKKKHSHVLDTVNALFPDIGGNFSLIKIQKGSLKIDGLFNRNLEINFKFKYSFIYVNKRSVNCARIEKLFKDFFKTRQIFCSMYIVNIKCPPDDVDFLQISDKTTIQFKKWSKIELNLQKLVSKLDSKRQFSNEKAEKLKKDQLSMSKMKGAVKSQMINKRKLKEINSSPNKVKIPKMDNLKAFKENVNNKIEDENKGKDLILDMFLKSTQIYNVDYNLKLKNASKLININQTILSTFTIKTINKKRKFIDETESVYFTKERPKIQPIIKNKKLESNAISKKQSHFDNRNFELKTSLENVNFSPIPKHFKLAPCEIKIDSFLNQSCFDIDFGNPKEIAENPLENQSMLNETSDDYLTCNSELNITLSNNQKEVLIANDCKIEKQINKKVFNLFPTQQSDLSKNTKLSFFARNQKDKNKDKENVLFKLRPSHVPKGLSPIVLNSPKPDLDVSLEKPLKEQLFKAIFETYENELNLIKWQSYLEKMETKKFFDDLYKEKVNCRENVVPSMDKISNKLDPVVFNKELLQNLKCIGQWDKKFIIALEKSHKLLILFDQHAAHERVSLESILKDKNIVFLKNPVHLQFSISKSNISKLTDYFQSIHFKINASQIGVEFLAIPAFISKRFHNKFGNLQQFLKLLVMEVTNLLKSDGILTLRPKIIQDVMNIMACRGSVKFGDKLSSIECGELLKKLSKCNLPFQCAHGRPSLTLLLDFNDSYFKKIRKNTSKIHLNRLGNKNKRKN